MDILYTVITSLASVLTLFVIVKVLGNKEIAQLSMFDYINGITIGSIAAEMSTCEKGEFHEPFIGMIVYAAVILTLTILSNKFLPVRRFVEGKALVILDNGKINFSNLKYARMDINEFLMQCRMNGYFNLEDIQTAVLEANGRVSVLPKSNARPVNAKDLKLSPEPEKLVVNVVIDGVCLKQNLSATGNSKSRLEADLKKCGADDLSEVLLATYDYNNKLTVYKKSKMDKNIDNFNI